MTKRSRRTHDQWHALIAEFQGSDISAEGFCLLHDLGRMSFDKWRLRFSRTGSVGFTELKSTPTGSAPPVSSSPLTLIWLLYKRLESQRFAWPRWFEGDSLCLTPDQLGQLLDGVDLNALRGHRPFDWRHVA